MQLQAAATSAILAIKSQYPVGLQAVRKKTAVKAMLSHRGTVNSAWQQCQRKAGTKKLLDSGEIYCIVIFLHK